MASAKPIIKPINYLYLAIHTLIIILFTGIYYFYNFELPFITALLTFSMLSILLKYTVSKSQRKGIRLFKAGQYEDAIKEFLKSYDFFIQHSWIDKYRVIFILSLSQLSFQEMALLNIALCYSQIGDGLKSKEWYERVLQEFPDNEIAKTALRLFLAAKNIYITS